MNKVVSILGVAAFAVVVAQADQVIKFSNAATDIGAGKLVTFDGSFGAGLAGKGVVNLPQGGLTGTETRSYVAALFISNGGTLTQVGAIANFRPNTTGSPGTWSGANRTALGVTQGDTLTLVVQAWDAAFASYDLAKANGKGYGQSAPFTFKDALSTPASPNDTLMSNFQGFTITQIPEPSTIALGALGVVGLLFLRRK